MSATRKRYTPEYRRECARLVIESQRTIVDVARELGIGEQLLGRWVAKERALMDDPPPAIDADERAELERLRAEVAQLKIHREFLKKSRGLLRLGELDHAEAFELIATETKKADAEITVVRGCEMLEVSRAGFYAWCRRRNAGPGPRAARRAEMATEVARVHAESDRVYGAPRITAELREHGHTISRKTVAKLMSEPHIFGSSGSGRAPISAASISGNSPLNSGCPPERERSSPRSTLTIV